jgi:hypothetical protein
MKERRTGEYVGSIVGNIVALVLVNMVLIWRPWTAGVILESWVDILWAADLSIVLQIVGSFLLVFYRPRWFDSLLRLLFSAAGLLSLIVFYLVFPIDLSGLVGDWLNLTLRTVLIVGMGVTLIVGIVQLVRFLAAGLHLAGA